MNILGIGDNHDAGAALILDGKIVAAVNEERLTRIKLSGGFPSLSIRKVLEIAKISPRRIDKVVIASYFTPVAFLRYIEKLYQKHNRRVSQFSYFFNLYILYQVLLSEFAFLKKLEVTLSKKILKRKLKKLGINCEIHFIEHHLAHTYSALILSGCAEESLVITADSMGDGISLTVNRASPKSIKRIYEEKGFSGISSYYSRITELLGFKPIRHEGKVTALAAYADADKALDIVNFLLNFRQDEFNKINYFLKQSKRSKLYKKLLSFSREEIAAAVQKNLELEFCKFVKFWLQKTSLHNLALAGGLFANIKLNQRIHELPEVESVFITPHMGDGGLALGAALYGAEAAPSTLDNIYLGDSYPDSEMEKELKEFKLKYRYYEQTELEKYTAQLLGQGKIIGLFRGRLEFGPRALGNRSILYHTVDPAAKEIINHKLGRTEFMPFSPVTLFEYTAQCYLDTKGAEYTARFMNMSFDCTDWMKKNCPGVVHIDGTARPQLVLNSENPFFYNLIEEYRKLTGIPSIINTSFNLHEEPIVATPKQAIESFLEAELDYLVLGNIIVWADSH